MQVTDQMLPKIQVQDGAEAVLANHGYAIDNDQLVNENFEIPSIMQFLFNAAENTLKMDSIDFKMENYEDYQGNIPGYCYNLSGGSNFGGYATQVDITAVDDNTVGVVMTLDNGHVFHQNIDLKTGVLSYPGELSLPEEEFVIPDEFVTSISQAIFNSAALRPYDMGGNFYDMWLVANESGIQPDDVSAIIQIVGDHHPAFDRFYDDCLYQLRMMVTGRRPNMLRVIGMIHAVFYGAMQSYDVSVEEANAAIDKILDLNQSLRFKLGLYKV